MALANLGNPYLVPSPQFIPLSDDDLFKVPITRLFSDSFHLATNPSLLLSVHCDIRTQNDTHVKTVTQKLMQALQHHFHAARHLANPPAHRKWRTTTQIRYHSIPDLVKHLKSLLNMENIKRNGTRR
jgi:hypothetical protein